MSERNPCIRCGRAIDEWSKICPFCNWNQSATPPAHESVPTQVAAYTPPEERSVKKLVAYAGAAVLLLFVAFGIGMLINSDAAPDEAPVPVSEQEQQKIGVPRRADTTLVPVNEPAGVEQPITSAPAAAPAQGALANEYDRSDATAVSATEYAQMAKRAKAEKKKMAVLVDPRSLTGVAYGQPARPVRPAPVPVARQQPLPFPDTQSSNTQAAEPPREVRRQVMRTRAVPRYQPVPRLRARGAARFDLLVGADGRVKDITVRRAIDGNTAALIGAVQTWRFKPATENGEAVASSFTVEISFGGR